MRAMAPMVLLAVLMSPSLARAECLDGDCATPAGGELVDGIALRKQPRAPSSTSVRDQGFPGSAAADKVKGAGDLIQLLEEANQLADAAERRRQSEQERALMADLATRVLEVLPDMGPKQRAQACDVVYPTALKRGLLTLSQGREFYLACTPQPADSNKIE